VRGGPDPDSITLEAYGMEIPEALDHSGAVGRLSGHTREGRGAWSPALPYSPNVLEEEFPEVRIQDFA
jgi:hypothetical protein